MRFFILTILGCLISAPVLAASACYSPAELQAEHLLRLHSELMVITVTCRTGSQGEDLVSAYTGFTNRNIRELHDAEQTMMNYYKEQGKSQAVEWLDKLRTKLGNEFGQAIADISAPIYCKKNRDKVLTFHTMSKADVENEVQRMMIAEHSYVKPCSAPSSQLAKKIQ